MWNAEEPKAETKLGSFHGAQSSRTWLAKGEIVGDEWEGAQKKRGIQSNGQFSTSL